MSTSLPVCPLLSIRATEAYELCMGADCALYLPAAKKCSLVYVGYKAMLEVQRMQMPQTPQAQQPPR